MGGRNGRPSGSFARGELQLPRWPLLMGIVNVTPDSFSDGGRYFEPQAAIDHACSLVAMGPIYSTSAAKARGRVQLRLRVQEELDRVLPVR